MQVGFIGLGIMGTPMAAHLLKAGHKLYLRNLGRISQDLIGARAVVCTSGAEVARNADIIIIMVPDTPDVGKVLFGPDGVASGLTKGKTVVDMSSISPIETKNTPPRSTSSAATTSTRLCRAARSAPRLPR